jgi:hypothetical protein
MMLTEIADRTRLANQARLNSLCACACSITLMGLSLVPAARQSPPLKAGLLVAAAALATVSKITGDEMADHDRVLQDFRDISDNQRQQAIYEALKPAAVLAPEPLPVAAMPPAMPTHNLSRAIAGKLKSTVVLGAPRAGKGYALAKALELLPSNIDLWLIDPKNDARESHYWHRVPSAQRCQFDVTELSADEADALVTAHLNEFLEASSSAAKPKLLVVDECSPGLSMGMSSKAYKTLMGRLATICSVGPSKGKFVWIMAQASTVADLGMSNGNKASFRLCAVGHAQNTEGSWYRSLNASMGIDKPDPLLTGYIQMVDGQWGYSEPFELSRYATEPAPPPTDTAPKTTNLPIASQSALDFLKAKGEPVGLRQLTQAKFARREGLTKQSAMSRALEPLIEGGLIEEGDDGDYALL